MRVLEAHDPLELTHLQVLLRFMPPSFFKSIATISTRSLRETPVSESCSKTASFLRPRSTVVSALSRMSTSIAPTCRSGSVPYLLAVPTIPRKVDTSFYLTSVSSSSFLPDRQSLFRPVQCGTETSLFGLTRLGSRLRNTAQVACSVGSPMGSSLSKNHLRS